MRWQGRASRPEERGSGCTASCKGIENLFGTSESAAEKCVLTALDLARRPQAKSLELRAVMSLSGLWQHHRKSAAARQLLAELYNWFTEGFDTKDLQEAKALLEELA